MAGDAGGRPLVHEEQRVGQPWHRELQAVRRCPVHSADRHGGVAQADVAKPSHYPCTGFLIT